MIYVEYAKRRYDAAIAEIERLKQSEFPYADIQDALLQLEKFFCSQRSQLDKLTLKIDSRYRQERSQPISRVPLHLYAISRIHPPLNERSQCV